MAEKEPTTEQRARIAADRIAGAIILDDASETRHLQAVRQAFRDPNADRLVNRATRALVAVHGEEKLKDDAFLAENVRVSLMRLFLNDADPSAGDVVRVLSFLSEKHGDRTISEVLAEMTPKPEPEE